MSGQVARRSTAPGEAAGGSIYDLGYRHYEGTRLGRGAAFQALYLESLRAIFGIGRPARAKLLPFGLLLLAVVPAVVAVSFEALAGGVVTSPIRYDNYLPTVLQILILFVAAQAPELVGRDQRYHVLSLYFSRALDRLDYALARLAALATALFAVAVLPQAAIFAGKVLAARDLMAALGDNVVQVPPILLSTIVAAAVVSSLALAVASLTSRRAYATAAIFASFYLTLSVFEIVAAILQDRTDLARYVHLLVPTAGVEGLTAWSFGVAPSQEALAQANLPPELYAASAVVWAAVGLVVLLRRYARIAA